MSNSLFSWRKVWQSAIFLAMFTVFVAVPTGAFAQSADSIVPNEVDVEVLSQEVQTQDGMEIDVAGVSGAGITVLADETLLIEEDIVGTAFIAGGDIDIPATVNGNLFVAGGNIVLSGTVTQDVFVAGGTVIIQGEIQGNVFGAGGEVRITPEAEITGSAALAGERVTQAGMVGAQSWLAAKTAELAGTNAADVWVGAETVLVQETARVAGTLQGEYGEVQIDDTAQIQNNALQEMDRTPHKEESTFESWIKTTLWYFVGGMIVAVAMWKLLPKWSATALELWQEKPGATLLSGVVLFVTLPLLSLVLLVTVVGMPLSLIVALLWLLSLATGWVWVVEAAALPWLRKFDGTKDWSIWIHRSIIFVGVAAISALPVLGWTFRVVVAAWGIGLWGSLIQRGQR